MATARMRKTVTIDAPLAFVFERMVDHEAMSDWPGVSGATLSVEGSPTRNGLGAVRVIKAKGLALHEEVVHFEPPHRYDYSIIKGLPVDHLGTVRLEEIGDSVELSWEVTISSAWPFLAQIVTGLLARELPTALAHLKRDTERRFEQQS